MVALLMLTAAHSGESLCSIAARTGRAESTVQRMLRDVGYVSRAAAFRGDRRFATGRAMALRFRNGATVEDLMTLWDLAASETVVRILAEWDIDARTATQPRRRRRRPKSRGHLTPGAVTAAGPPTHRPAASTGTRRSAVSRECAAPGPTKSAGTAPPGPPHLTTAMTPAAPAPRRRLRAVPSADWTRWR
ncbi:hypothetical protein KUTG_10129 [Kutzneria sp. 744]|nr:hypothetical protein KUTG_10129 [Kutzneria sp. 744]